jgi:hypothetical protein
MKYARVLMGRGFGQGLKKLAAVIVVTVALHTLACGDPDEESTTHTASVFVPASAEPILTNTPAPQDPDDSFELIPPGAPAAAELKYATPPSNVTVERRHDVVALSELFVEPETFGAGSALVSAAQSMSAGEVIAVELTYEVTLSDGENQLQLIRWKGLALPVEIDAPLDGGPLTLERGRVGGHPAVFIKSGVELAVQDIWFIEGDVVTFLRGHGSFDEILALAEVVAAAAAASP